MLVDEVDEQSDHEVDIIHRSAGHGNQLLKTICFVALSLCLGLCCGLIGPCVLDIKELIGCSIGDISWLFASHAAGSLLGSLIGMFTSDSIYWIVVMLLLLAVCVSIIPWSTSLSLLAGAFALHGLTSGVIQTKFESSSSVTTMPMCHAAFGIGATTGPILFALFINGRYSVHDSVMDPNVDQHQVLAVVSRNNSTSHRRRRSANDTNSPEVIQSKKNTSLDVSNLPNSTQYHLESTIPTTVIHKPKKPPSADGSKLNPIPSVKDEHIFRDKLRQSLNNDPPAESQPNDVSETGNLMNVGQENATMSLSHVDILVLENVTTISLIKGTATNLNRTYLGVNVTARLPIWNVTDDTGTSTSTTDDTGTTGTSTTVVGLNVSGSQGPIDIAAGVNVNNDTGTDGASVDLNVTNSQDSDGTVPVSDVNDSTDSGKTFPDLNTTSNSNSHQTDGGNVTVDLQNSGTSNATFVKVDRQGVLSTNEDGIKPVERINIITSDATVTVTAASQLALITKYRDTPSNTSTSSAGSTLSLTLLVPERLTVTKSSIVPTSSSVSTSTSNRPTIAHHSTSAFLLTSSNRERLVVTPSNVSQQAEKAKLVNNSSSTSEIHRPEMEVYSPARVVYITISIVLVIMSIFIVYAKRHVSFLVSLQSTNRKGCGFRTGAIALFTVVAILHFFRSGAEWTIAGLMPSFVEVHLQWKRSTAVLLVAAFWLSFTCGRSIGSSLLTSHRIRPWPLMLGGLTSAFLAMAILAVSVSQQTNMMLFSWWHSDAGKAAPMWVGSVLFGFGTSVVVPAADSFLPQGHYPTLAKAIGSAVGEMVVPVLSGTMSVVYGADWIISTAFAAVAGGLSVCLILWCVASPSSSRRTVASARVQMLGDSVKAIMETTKSQDDAEGAATDTNEEEDAELLSKAADSDHVTEHRGDMRSYSRSSHLTSLHSVIRIGNTAKRD